MKAAVIQMVSHGLVAAGLFLMVGMIYERCHTRDLAAYGGLAKVLALISSSSTSSSSTRSLSCWPAMKPRS